MLECNITVSFCCAGVLRESIVINHKGTQCRKGGEKKSQRHRWKELGDDTYRSFSSSCRTWRISYLRRMSAGGSGQSMRSCVFTTTFQVLTQHPNNDGVRTSLTVSAVVCRSYDRVIHILNVEIENDRRPNGAQHSWGLP